MPARPAFRIPFNRPFLAGAELDHIKEALALGNLGGDGKFSALCTQRLQQILDAKEVLLTSSCTTALEIALAMTGVGPGDEVILPAFTYVSTANAVIRQGATPVWADIQPDTLCLDPHQVEAALTPRTRAIMQVHYGGVPCDMRSLASLAGKHGLFLIEDAAAALGASYQGTPLATLGEMGCISFHETKNLGCGQGGALCLNRPELVEAARVFRDRGTNRHQFNAGLTSHYTWVGPGSAGSLSELAAAYLWGQLEQFEEISSRRSALFQNYLGMLEPLIGSGRIQIPSCPADCQSSHHTFALMTRDRQQRDGLLDHLHRQGILATIHYVPLHTSPMGLKIQPQPLHLPVTERVADCLVRLPLYHTLTIDEQEEVASATLEYFLHTGRF